MTRKGGGFDGRVAVYCAEELSGWREDGIYRSMMPFKNSLLS